MADHVAVCVPSGEMVHADFMLSLLHLVQNARADGLRVSLVNSKSSVVTHARNLAVDAALESRAEWIAFLDSDMVFPSDTLPRLLAPRLPVVGATYARKSWPLGFIGTRLDGSAITLADTGMIDVARLPAGCLLLNASVFSKLKRPYFRCGYDEVAGEVLGEDFWFSEKLSSLGYTLKCDTQLSRQIEHIGLFRYACKESPPR